MTDRTIFAMSDMTTGFIKKPLIPKAVAFSEVILSPNPVQTITERRPNLLDRSGKPVAGEPRHGHIGDHEVEILFLRFKNARAATGSVRVSAR